jgi:hypothetical protein
MIAALREFWDQTFPGVPPIPHRFREWFADRWVRFHSLPESKRYPDSEGEYSTILSRHNELLDGLARGKEITLVTAGYSQSEIPIRDNSLSNWDSAAEHWRTVPMHILDGDSEDLNYWHLFASDFVWTPGAIDPILRLVANDELANIFVLSVGDNWLYHPYDGGADVILPTTESRDILRSHHAEWLSPHSAGL